LERKVLDSQERAFWDVHRPMVIIAPHQFLATICTYLEIKKVAVFL
jgi:hypothetical protein